MNPRQRAEKLVEESEDLGWDAPPESMIEESIEAAERDIIKTVLEKLSNHKGNEKAVRLVEQWWELEYCKNRKP